MHYIGHSANNIFIECLQINTWQNNYTRQKTYLPSAGNKTLGKQQQDTRQRIYTQQKTATCAGRQPGCRPLELYQVFLSGTRQIGSFAECFILALDKLKKFFSSPTLETLSTLHIQHVVLHVKIWYISGSVCYI